MYPSHKLGAAVGFDCVGNLNCLHRFRGRVAGAYNANPTQVGWSEKLTDGCLLVAAVGRFVGRLPLPTIHTHSLSDKVLQPYM